MLRGLTTRSTGPIAAGRHLGYKSLAQMPTRRNGPVSSNVRPHKMSPAPATSEDAPLEVGNYIVGFMDLLGQRIALRGQGLLPDTKSDEGQKKLIEVLKASVGSISALQRHAMDMMDASESRADSPLRAHLPAEKQKLWDELMRTKITTQRWSDGLMIFAALADGEITCPMNSVYRLFTLSGALCLLGLASKRPLRGAIEIAWGVELHPGELYGAAVARAYELESEVADYPRIVVGPQAVKYLELQSKNPGASPKDQIGKALASLCLQMIVQDADGHYLIHYLGNTFIGAVTNENHANLFARAEGYVLAQLEQHKNSKNTKLAFRYVHLAQYFGAHPPQSASGGA